MKVKDVRCPVCGSDTAPGELTVVSGRGAVLFWRSDKKLPRKYPVKLLGKLFKTDFFQQKAIKVNLMAASFTLTTGDPAEHVPAWYCPSCKKVFAWFDAPGVPPELCEGETGNSEGGAR